MNQAGLAETVATRYSALVDYRKPSFEELEKIFDAVGWSEKSHASLKFEHAGICRDIPTQPRQLEFGLRYFGRHMETNEALGELMTQGLRPATYEEALAVAPQLALLQQAFPIAVLGSIAMIDAWTRSPYLYWNAKDEEWCLRHYSIDSGWVSTVRYLVVFN